MNEPTAGPDTGPGTSYWYEGDHSAVLLLSALRRFRTADGEMRRRMSAGMDMNTTDLAALRIVIAHEAAAEPVTPLQLARELGISGASTSKLLDRLAASGHLERVQHPRDGRSRIVVATDHAHAQVRERLGDMHRRMLEIAQDVPGPAREAAIDFLLAMAEHLEAEGVPDSLPPPER
ncbi:MarR family transcriptional regulator [Brachybacterium ginsengisoli]|uniref:MarR family transcriptional regulator n=1 Tax=Brachybacterium ginsengisoli TaxID=1331682 RepID=A0A291H0C6_9MICO|nr:MarR family transcriptional regulator [Brachybacterium ginsengisoli]ATG55921.1 MarR family transcriptional regulator [Brachybacterium ginsengisoli]